MTLTFGEQRPYSPRKESLQCTFNLAIQHCDGKRIELRFCDHIGSYWLCVVIEGGLKKAHTLHACMSNDCLSPTIQSSSVYCLPVQWLAVCFAAAWHWHWRCFSSIELLTWLYIIEVSSHLFVSVLIIWPCVSFCDNNLSSMITTNSGLLYIYYKVIHEVQ